jgi:hypothetical protein
MDDADASVAATLMTSVTANHIPARHTFRFTLFCPSPVILNPDMRIPIYSGRVFRREAGHRSDLKPATIPK